MKALLALVILLATAVSCQEHINVDEYERITIDTPHGTRELLLEKSPTSRAPRGGQVYGERGNGDEGYTGTGRQVEGISTTGLNIRVGSNEEEENAPLLREMMGDDRGEEDEGKADASGISEDVKRVEDVTRDNSPGLGTPEVDAEEKDEEEIGSGREGGDDEVGEEERKDVKDVDKGEADEDWSDGLDMCPHSKRATC